jgi:hypothetical protein
MYSAITEFFCAMSTATSIRGYVFGACTKTGAPASALDACFVDALLLVE